VIENFVSKSLFVQTFKENGVLPKFMAKRAGKINGLIDRLAKISQILYYLPGLVKNARKIGFF
jgi:hypothetical protein